jgi:putative hydrolase of the HAD superfamily
VKAVLLDFYGTIGESEWVEHWFDQVLAERGYRVERDVSRRLATEAWDGREHAEHSASEKVYNAWERERWRAVMAASDVAEADVIELLDALDERKAAFRMRLFPEVHDVLLALRDRGLRLAVCSNWDWDLDRHLHDAGIADLLDARVSSAWVGARKPHPRIYERALAEVGAEAGEALFVGDNWAADVEGPVALGMRAAHVWRHDETPDWLPEVPPDGTVTRVRDLTGLLELVP